MENRYDYVILGTSLQQCILAYRIAERGLKVLQIDKNKSYGSDLRTLNYKDLCERCDQELNPTLKEMNRKFNIDISPKFLLADGLMKTFLIKNDIQNLVSFTDITGHFVFRRNGLHSIPHNEKASIMSGLISMFQKPKVAKFFWSVRKYSENKERSQVDKKGVPQESNDRPENKDKSQVDKKGVPQESNDRPKEKDKSQVDKKGVPQESNDRPKEKDKSQVDKKGVPQESNDRPENKERSSTDTDNLIDDLTPTFQFHTTSMKREFEHYGLNKDSIDLIGHAIALNLDDSYLYRHPSYTYDKIYYYIRSLVSLNGIKTPFIYPLYGISELCQAFSRRAGMAGCVFRLNTQVLEIKLRNGEIIEKIGETGGDIGGERLRVGDCSSNIQASPHFSSDNSNADNSISTNNELIENLTISDQYKFTIKILDPMTNKPIQIHSNKIISETSYLPTKSKIHHQIITGILIIKDQIPLIHKKYRETNSAHILFLANEINRSNDIFMAILSEREQAAPENYQVCIINTIRETEKKPIEEIAPFFKLLGGNIQAQFVWHRDVRVMDSKCHGLVVVNDVDETTHLESIYEDYVRCYREVCL